MRLNPGPRYLAQDPAATLLHSTGLHASIYDHDHARARDFYVQAFAQVPVDGLADHEAQYAGIMRDYAFTFTREGAHNPDRDKFRIAREGLRQALGVTALLINEPQRVRFQKDGIPLKKKRRELLGVHAATIELLARNAIAEEVIFGSSEDTVADSLHGWAHDFGRLSNTGYNRVSNDIRNALQERTKGTPRLPHTVKAVGRATVSMLWTTFHNPGALVAAGRTFVGHLLLALPTPTTARRSILARP